MLKSMGNWLEADGEPIIKQDRTSTDPLCP